MKGGFAMNRMAATGMFLALALLGTLQGGSSFAADVVKDGASGDKMPQAMAADKAEKETVSAPASFDRGHQKGTLHGFAALLAGLIIF